MTKHRSRSHQPQTPRKAPARTSNRVATEPSEAATANPAPKALATRPTPPIARGEQGPDTAAQEVRRAAQRTARLAKDHPAVAAGALVGVGMLVGAVAQHALRKPPSLGEVLMKTLSSRAGKASKVAGQGLKSAAQKLRKSVR
jgi:hypothetical protein